MRPSQLRRLSLLLVVCLFVVSATKVPLCSRAEADADAAEIGDVDPEIDLDVLEEPAEEVDEKDVVVLTEKNFNDTVLKAPFALVEFYAPWCGHCQALKPEYAKAATELKALDSSIVIGKVDATEEVELGNAFGVQGYPTLKWFVSGETREYGGGRTAEDIVKWIKKKTGPPAETIKNLAGFHAIKNQTLFLVAYFEEFKGASYEAFLEAAKVADDVPIYQTEDYSVAKKVGITKPGFVLTRTFKGHHKEEAAYLKEVTKEGLLAWLKEEKLPAYLEFNDENQDAIFGSGIPINILLVGSEKQVAADSDAVKAIREAHKSTKGKLIFVTTTLGSDNAEAITDFFGLKTDAKELQVVAFNMDTSQKYKLHEKLTPASLKKFAEGILNGSVKPDYKSEDVPTGDDAKDGDVVVVVGKTFDDIVLDASKDVLLEAYAPWCGHCKQLAPTYRKLAKRFRDVDSVVIAKIEATANEHEKLNVEGFPTLLFFPASNKGESVAYDGADRSLKAMTQFIKQHATKAFELPKKQTEAEDAEEAAAIEKAAAEEAASALEDFPEDPEAFGIEEAAEAEELELSTDDFVQVEPEEEAAPKDEL